MHPNKRNECGWPGISKATCEDRGCCFDNSFPGVKWCFPKEITEGRNKLLLSVELSLRYYLVSIR